MNSSVMFLILIITRKRLTVLSVYASRMERTGEKSEKCWVYLKWCAECCENKGRVSVTGHINTIVGDADRKTVLDKFGIPVTSKNRECLGYNLGDKPLTLMRSQTEG